MTLSTKTSLMLEVHKAGFRREGHISLSYHSTSLERALNELAGR